MPAPPPSPDDRSADAAPFDDLGGVAALLDIELVEQSAERVVATMPVTRKHHQPFGVLHGGVNVVLAESVASVGAFLATPEGRVPVGIEVNANHVRSVESGPLRAVGTPLHTGRSTHVWSARIYDEDDALICASRCTLAVVDSSDASAP